MSDHHSLVIDAGQHARRDVLVEFALPVSAACDWIAEDDAGRSTPVQSDAHGHGSTVLADLAAHERRRLRLRSATATTSVSARTQGEDIVLARGQRDVTRYRGGAGELPNGYAEEQRRAGYLHPLITPRGRMVTDDFPPHHQHHHGAWWAYADTLFQGRQMDFWNVGGKTGTVRCAGIDSSWSGAVHAGFVARHQFVDLTAPSGVQPVLDETWEIRLLANGGERWHLIDLLSVQRCSGADSADIQFYPYGGLGVRGRRDWDGADGMRFLTSDGLVRANGNHSRARWCWMGGQVDGDPAGIAILGHPGNFRAPQSMRLHPNEPFFCFSPSPLGPWRIESGRLHVSRYRLAIGDGDADPAEIERLWRDFSEPPRAISAP